MDKQKLVYGNWNNPDETEFKWVPLGAARRFAIPGSACTICVNLIKHTPAPPDAPERPPHQHPHEQIMLIYEGDGEVVVDGERYPMSAGSYIVIPPNVPHCYNARKATMDIVNIDVFTPTRDEFVVRKEDGNA